MKCEPNHGPAVATVQIIHPMVSPRKDDICEPCLRWWEDFRDGHPEFDIRIEWLSTEAGGVESVASAVLLLASVALFTLAMGGIR